MKEYRYGNNKKSNKGKYIVSGILIVLAVSVGIYFWIINQNKAETPDNVAEQQTEENTNEQPVEEQKDETSNESEQQNEGTLTNGGYIEGQPEPTEPTYIDGVLIANKSIHYQVILHQVKIKRLEQHLKKWQEMLKAQGLN